MQLHGHVGTEGQVSRSMGFHSWCCEGFRLLTIWFTTWQSVGCLYAGHTYMLCYDMVWTLDPQWSSDMRTCDTQHAMQYTVIVQVSHAYYAIQCVMVHDWTVINWLYNESRYVYTCTHVYVCPYVPSYHVMIPSADIRGRAQTSLGNSEARYHVW